MLKLYCRHCNSYDSFLEFFKKKFLQVFSLFNLENIFLLVFMLTLLITVKWKKKTRLFQPLQTLTIPSSPFCTRVLQPIQALKDKSNPNQAFQNAIATLLLLSHKKYSIHFSKALCLTTRFEFIFWVDLVWLIPGVNPTM